jgi:hypothetical protein
MHFEKKDYIKHEINRLASKKFDCIYCYCDIDTIPLETYYDVSSIPSEQEYEGNMVWVANPESEHDDIKYYIFVGEKWMPALLTSDENLYAEVTSAVREHKINELID